jgi:hypothetical protein
VWNGSIGDSFAGGVRRRKLRGRQTSRGWPRTLPYAFLEFSGTKKRFPGL